MRTLISIIYCLLSVLLPSAQAQYTVLSKSESGAIVVEYKDPAKADQKAETLTFRSVGEFRLYLTQKQNAIVAFNDAMIDQLRANEQRLAQIQDAIQKSEVGTKPKTEKPDRKPP